MLLHRFWIHASSVNSVKTVERKNDWSADLSKTLLCKCTDRHKLKIVNDKYTKWLKKTTSWFGQSWGLNQWFQSPRQVHDQCLHWCAAQKISAIGQTLPKTTCGICSFNARMADMEMLRYSGDPYSKLSYATLSSSAVIGNSFPTAWTEVSMLWTFLSVPSSSP